MSTRRERANEPSRRLNKQLLAAEEAVKLRQERSRKNLHTANIYIDVAKLVFGGLVIGNMINESDFSYNLITVGLVMFFILLGIGNKYFNEGNKDVII